MRDMYARSCVGRGTRLRFHRFLCAPTGVFWRRECDASHAARTDVDDPVISISAKRRSLSPDAAYPSAYTAHAHHEVGARL